MFSMSLFEIYFDFIQEFDILLSTDGILGLIVNGFVSLKRINSTV